MTVKRVGVFGLQAALALICIGVLAGCAIADTTNRPTQTDMPSATPAEPLPPSTTPRPTPIATAGPRRPLPPTWTPTMTPTITRTPTEPPTPTASPTLSLAQICEGFAVSLSVAEGRSVRENAELAILLESSVAEGSVTLTFTNQDTGEVYSATLPTGSALIGTIPAAVLPGAGAYVWVARLTTALYPEPCEVGGTFTVLPALPTPTPASDVPTAETTAEATSEFRCRVKRRRGTARLRGITVRTVLAGRPPI